MRYLDLILISLNWISIYYVTALLGAGELKLPYYFGPLNRHKYIEMNTSLTLS